MIYTIQQLRRHQSLVDECMAPRAVYSRAITSKEVIVRESCIRSGLYTHAENVKMAIEIVTRKVAHQPEERMLKTIASCEAEADAVMTLVEMLTKSSQKVNT